MPLIAQAASETTVALTSVAGIVLATWLLVGIGKKLFDYKGKATLVVSLVVSMGLTVAAIYGTKTLAGDPFTSILAVLMAVASAAGVDATGSTLFKTGKATAILVPVFLLGGCCSGGMVPSASLQGILDTAAPDHLERIQKDIDESETPEERQRNTDAKATFERLYSTSQSVIDAAEGR